MLIKKKLMTMFTIFTMILSTSIPAMAAVSDTGFTDVAANAWYASAVEYSQSNGFMSGVSDIKFEPDSPVSRAMLVTALYQQADSPEVQATNSFVDVADDMWYSSSAQWAFENNIVTGMGGNRFEPNSLVTREQVAAILWRNEGSPQSNGTANSFSDQSSISDYAANAVLWAQENDIINGRYNNVFAPNATLTHGEAAVIFQNYFNLKNSQDTVESNPSDATEATAEDTAIAITMGDTSIPAVLNNSISAQALIARMPLTVSMTRGSADFYASLEEPFEYTEEDVHNGWTNGDIGFDVEGNYLTIFYSGEESSEGNENQITLGQISDLSLLSGIASGVQVTFALAATQADTPENTEATEENALVIYYSHTQRTQQVAQALSEKVNGELYEVIPANPYTGNDSAISSRATEEIESGNLPELSGELPDISQYDTIFIGGPVWSDTVAAPLLSYLESTDFSGKKVIPFSTDQGTSKNYEADFTQAVNNAREVTTLFPISFVSSMSDEEMSALLDQWLETVNQ